MSEIDQLEERVTELQIRVDNALTETAALRANPTIGCRKNARSKKKTKKFCG